MAFTFLRTLDQEKSAIAYLLQAVKSWSQWKCIGTRWHSIATWCNIKKKKKCPNIHILWIYACGMSSIHRCLWVGDWSNNHCPLYLGESYRAEANSLDCGRPLYDSLCCMLLRVVWDVKKQKRRVIIVNSWLSTWISVSLTLRGWHTGNRCPFGTKH